jgi:hypothetical protein
MKTEETLSLERDIWNATNKQGVFGCFEVTIGWFGDERVDYITYDTKGIWRCYEIKATKADFYSDAKKTFIGHFNYFVLTKSLYEEVKDDIPAHIGVYARSSCVKRAKRQDLQVDEQILKNSLIRSLSREVEKLIKSNDPEFVNRMNRIISNERREKEEFRTKFWNLQHRVWAKYGLRWDKEPSEAASE